MEDLNEDAVLPCIEGFLTASELVDLRKSSEEHVRQPVGDKFSTRTNSQIEEEAVKSSLASLKAALKQKRAARQCDLIQAVWDEEKGSALTTKLKGKYVHHMGLTVDGKIALSPEESMFLLENGVIEIMNGEAPMSTQEGFAVILKEKLSVEKYRVYSHLSQLGFIVIPYQRGLAATRYETEMNLNKRPLKKRKFSPIESQDNNKKRLTFSGALCNSPGPSIPFDDSEVHELSLDDTLPVESEVNKNKPEVCEESSISEIAAEVSCEDSAVDTTVQKSSIEPNVELEKEINKSSLLPSRIEELDRENFGPLPNGVKDANACQNKETEEPAPKKAIVSSIEEKATDVNEGRLGENNLDCEVMDVDVEMDQQIEVDDEMNGQCDTHNSVSCDEFQSTCERENVEQQLEIDSQPAILDEMKGQCDTHNSVSCSEFQSTYERENVEQQLEIDSQPAILDEMKGQCDTHNSVSCSEFQSTCERENVEQQLEIDSQPAILDEMKEQSDTHNSVSCSEFQSTYECENVEQQLEIDSQPAIEVSSRNEIDVMDVDSQNAEISSCSETSTDDEDGNNSVNAVSQDSCCSIGGSNVKANNVNGYGSRCRGNSSSSPLSCESEPLLDLSCSSSLSSRNEFEDDEVTLVEVTKKEIKPLAVIDLSSDDEQSSSESDDISIVKVCSASSGTMGVQASGVNCRKNLNGCKKEEQADKSIWTPKFQPPALCVSFPDLYQKDVVCVARPSLHLLPNHVIPSKEAYILDLKGMNNFQQPLQGRIGARTVPEFQRSRHMNQPLPQMHSRDNLEQPFMGRPYPDTYQDPSNRQTSLLGNPRNPSPGLYGNHPWENLRGPNQTPRFPPIHSMPNPFMNSMVSIQQQSLLGKPPYPSNAPGFPTNIPLPNIANMGQAQIMSEVQKTAFAVARSMLSYMFNQPNDGQPMPPFNPFGNANSHGSGPPNPSISYNTYSNPAPASNGYPSSLPDYRRGLDYRRDFTGQQRRHTGKPFPCHFRRAENKQSWETLKETVEGDKSDSSEVEEVPLTANEVFWDPDVLHPLVKAGILHEKSAVLNSLPKIKMANLNKRNLTDECFGEPPSLEVAFDVYLPGCNYRKTIPSIPKYRVIVIKATDPIPKISELAYIQRMLNDGASLRIAFVDSGDVSFMSCGSVNLPSLVPND